MTNPKRGEMELSLGNQTYQCRINMDVMMRIETAIGKSLIKLANTMQEGDMTALEMIAFLTPVLRSSGTDIKDKDVQKIVWEAGITNAMMAVAQVITFIIAGDDDEGNEEQAVSV